MRDLSLKRMISTSLLYLLLFFNLQIHYWSVKQKDRIDEMYRVILCANSLAAKLLK